MLDYPIFKNSTIKGLLTGIDAGLIIRRLIMILVMLVQWSREGICRSLLLHMHKTQNNHIVKNESYPIFEPITLTPTPITPNTQTSTSPL